MRQRKGRGWKPGPCPLGSARVLPRTRHRLEDSQNVVEPIVNACRSPAAGFFDLQAMHFLQTSPVSRRKYESHRSQVFPGYQLLRHRNASCGAPVPLQLAGVVMVCLVVAGFNTTKLTLVFLRRGLRSGQRRLPSHPRNHSGYKLPQRRRPCR